MERLKTEFDQKVRELFESNNRLINIKAESKRLNGINVDLEAQRRELQDELEKGKTKISMMNIQIENCNKELANEKADYEDIQNKAKEFSDTIDSLQKVIENVNGILSDISNKYTRGLLPILRNNSDIFGSNLTKFSFPEMRTLDPTECLENLLKWTGAFQDFIDLLIDSAENIRITIFQLNSNLDKEKNLNKELNDTMNTKINEISRIKRAQLELADENNAIQRRLNDTENKLAGILSEY